MAKIVFALNQSLDGFVDPTTRHFSPTPCYSVISSTTCAAWRAAVYGRRMYETMRYWDGDHFEWDAAEREYAAAWQSKPKWVVSRTLKSVGPNASLIEGDLAAAIRGLKAQHEGEIEVAGPELAHSLTELGLVDEYRLYLHPVVLGHGKPFFAGPRPPLRLVASDRIGEQVIRLTYVPA